MKRKKLASARMVYGSLTTLGFMCLFGAESFNPLNITFYLALGAALVSEAALTWFVFGTLSAKPAAEQVG